MIRTFTRSTRIVLAFGIASLVAIQPAAAQDSETNKLRSTVSYADLDLSSEAGRATLKGRIKLAATKACGGTPASRAYPREMQDFNECRDRAMAKAIAAIDLREGKALASR